MTLTPATAKQRARIAREYAAKGYTLKPDFTYTIITPKKRAKK